MSTRDVFENPWIRVTESEVLTPAGNPGRYGVVRFKNIAVGVVAFDEQDRLLMVGQYRYALGRYSWEIPEGGCPLGTSPLATARRELKEETGYRARSWSRILKLDLSNSSTDERAEIFLARGLEAGEAEPEETEQLQVRWMPFADVLREVRAGRITDAITVTAVLFIATERASNLSGKSRSTLRRRSR